MMTDVYSASQDLTFAIVAGQIVTFQLLGAWFGAAGLAFTVGLRRLPKDVECELRSTSRRTGRTQLWAGCLLLVAVGLLAAFPGLPSPVRRLGVTAVSLVSAALFIWTYVQERRTANRLREQLPPPDRLTADLRPRKLRRAYPLWLEALPPLLWLATLLLTLFLTQAAPHTGAGRQAGDAAIGEQAGSLDAAVRRFALPLVQGLLVWGGAWAARRILTRARYLPQKARDFLGDPADAVQLDWILRRLELRAFLAARILIAMMLGLWQWGHFGAPGSGTLNIPVSSLVWILVAGMLVVFGLFQRRVHELGHRP